MTSPKRAALYKKQLEYDQAMEDYRVTQTEVDEEVERLKVVLSEKEEQIRTMQKSISVKKDEIFLIKEKIKIKQQIIRERQASQDEYVPQPGEDIDMRFAAYCNQSKPTVPVKRLKQNEYMFGSTRISTRDHPKRDDLFKVKVHKEKKEYDSEAFFQKYEPIEMKVLERVRDDEELVVAETKVVEKRKADQTRLTVASPDAAKGKR